MFSFYIIIILQGHAESAAGICQLAKIAISIEAGMIPANLHFNKPSEYIKPLLDTGRMKIITEPTPFPGGVFGFSSFGLGGTNSHAILESEPQSPKPKSKMDEGYPIIIPFSGRTEEGLKESLEKAKEMAGNQDAVGLLHNAFRRNIPGHGVRGHVLLTKDTEPKISVETLKGIGEARPLWFVFPGMGSQWNESEFI